MSIDKNTVQYVAHLARIELEDKELEKLSGQLESIIHFIDKLSTLDVSKTPATSHILAIENVVREDKKGESLKIDDVLKNAPKRSGSFFSVPKVIE